MFTASSTAATTVPANQKGLVQSRRSRTIHRIAVAAGLAALLCATVAASFQPSAGAQSGGSAGGPVAGPVPTSAIDCDVVVVGGGMGGTSAAIAAAEGGARVCLLEETGWLGGQLTAAGVSTPDDNQYVERGGATASYAQLRDDVLRYYQTTHRMKSGFNEPSGSWVGYFGAEPKVWRAVLEDRVRPLVAAGRLQVFFRTRVTACELDPTGRRVEAVNARQQTEAGARDLFFRPRYVLDATELSTVIREVGQEGLDWRVGAESQAETGEPHAPQQAHRDWVQAFTFPFVLEWSPKTAAGNRIAKPEGYEQLEREQRYSAADGAIKGVMTGNMSWWTYRRLVAAQRFYDIQNDISSINTRGNDVEGGHVLATQAEDSPQFQAALEHGRRAALGYLYWLQNECPRDDDPTGKKRGYPEFRLRTDAFDTEDGCSVIPYIRESARFITAETIKEQDIAADHQVGQRAVFMPDSVGVGHYSIDIHSRGEMVGMYAATRPFQIPLGALIPARFENLLPAGHNLGVTHITNGAYRLHPIEWNIGESAGLLTAFCLQADVTPRQVYANGGARAAYQNALIQQGVPLYWFTDVPQNHPAFEAVQSLVMAGAPVSTHTSLQFRPNDRITASEWQAWTKAAGVAAAASFSGTRAQAAIALYQRVASARSQAPYFGIVRTIAANAHTICDRVASR